VKIIEWLQKLGILRFGVKAAVYRNGADRPVEFMMDDVFNAEKNLVYRESAGSKPGKKRRWSKQSDTSGFSLD